MPERSGSIRTLFLSVFATLSFGSIALADGPPFDLPVVCAGNSCDIVHYVDHDAGPNIRDYACGTTTYDGHRGTDFAIPDEATMLDGVPVLSIADGTVVALRDGVEDIDSGRIATSSLEGIECGNGILIDHDDGWQSQYCHLRRGWVAVKQGDRVSRGQVIGRIGISGQATFPHLHFNLRKDGELVDPFSGTAMGTSSAADCNVENAALWSSSARAKLSYNEITLYGHGFSMARPNASDLKRGYGKDQELPRTSPALYFWAYLIGANDGDVIRMSLQTPDGKGGHRDFVIDLPNDAGPRAKWFFINMDRPGSQWPAGTYEGEITFTRGDNSPRIIGEGKVMIR
ncbi:MAG: peptidase M23 [Thalassospira sp.]|uniref:M23 family metallopeptidase n=1 Tax=Thalassospira sp. UBA4513 TaxID=1947675 RepID=UPI000C69A1D1|nr:M23 family metallopeptidase [Thalassospira sp. UBA4513]MBE70523.1 peptidase M23 [Thalassospira sp.]|tara:strand:- start:1094 stop:2122 length:1029 start_codon:yes stop_codon:yes gene_type:complete